MNGNKLLNLKIQGKLYANGQTHNLVLNDTNHISVDNSTNTDFQINKANLDYWYQYFDWTTLSAYTNAEGDISDTYEILLLQTKQTRLHLHRHEAQQLHSYHH